MGVLPYHELPDMYDLALKNYDCVSELPVLGEMGRMNI